MLQKLGFTEYEARAYLALLDGGDLNGYEIAKAAGIPRANVYAVAAKLLQRGAAQRLQSTAGQRYAAVPPERLLSRIETGHKRLLSAARTALAQRPQPQLPTAVFTLRDDELLTQARQCIDACEQDLLIALQPAGAAQLADALRHAHERGVAITTLCMELCAAECDGCQGDIYRYQMAPADALHWLVLVADQRSALIGQLSATSIEGVVTEHPLVVELTAAYIKQSLALATLGGALAERFEGLLPQQARQLLDRLYPGGDFPAYIRSLSGIVSP